MNYLSDLDYQFHIVMIYRNYFLLTKNIPIPTIDSTTGIIQEIDSTQPN